MAAIPLYGDFFSLADLPDSARQRQTQAEARTREEHDAAHEVAFKIVTD